jgi:SAM-dependent methyltransferase
MVEIWHHGMRAPGRSRAAYEALYAARGLCHLDSFYLWILDLIAPVPGSLLLDVACGEGTLVAFARRRGVVAVGLDLAAEAVMRARARTGSADFLVGNGERLPFADAAFDIVTCIGSLEHFLDPSSGAREIARVLRQNGRAYILLPNTFSLLGNLLYVWRHGEVFDDGQPIQRYNTCVGWRLFLEQNGLRVERIEKYEVPRPRTWRDLWWYLRRPRKIGHLLVVPFIPLNLANCFMYVCTKA